VESVTLVMQMLTEALGDRYSLEREIGRGGMATVYLARDVRDGRSVAIKVMHRGLATALGTERFLREIEIAASLSHPGIVPLYDSGNAGELLYYVMPYLEGESLYQALERRRREAVPGSCSRPYRW
jgi:eukaryotic-like serine/threonine-protein kinase